MNEAFFVRTEKIRVYSYFILGIKMILNFEPLPDIGFNLIFPTNYGTGAL
jgi:hypothetical protein